MARLSTLLGLLLALAQPHLVCSRQVVPPGGEYRQECHLRVAGDPTRYTIQFYIEKTEVNIFNSRHAGVTPKLISNGTTIEPLISNNTDRYRVQEDNGIYTLIITDVVESDSAWYACRSFDVERNETRITLEARELLVPGPFDGVFWTANYSKLNLDYARQNEIPDGGTVLTDNAWHGPNVACAVLVSNVEPAVNITIGRYGEPGSVDITHQFETRTVSRVVFNNVGTVYRFAVFFIKKQKFTQTSLRDVYCRASVLSRTDEKSVNIQVTSKPQNKACEPQTAVVGSRNVRLSCLIEAHPAPRVEWTLPGGATVNALSNNPNYTVTNEARFEGLLTTLTISEVTEEDKFGRFEIEATNTEGSGVHSLYLRQGDPSAAGVVTSSVSLVTMTTCLLLWTLR